MTGMKLITTEPMDFRNTTVVGLAVAVGMGVTQASESLAQFPDWVNDYIWKITGSSCNYCGDCVKLNSAKNKEVDFEFVGRGFLKEGNPFLKASVL